MEKNDQVMELLQRPEFKQWVYYPTAESNHYWKNWLTHNPDQEQNVLCAKEILLRLRFKEGKLSNEEADLMLQNITTQSGRFTPPPALATPYLKYAAAIALVVCMGLLFWKTSRQATQVKSTEQTVTYKSNPKGQRSVIRLKDGTKVHLNANSTLRYGADFGIANRTVELDGEAYFAVAKDPQKPFVVKSGKVSTTALGTEFNINSTEKNKIRVTLIEGKVKVEDIAVSHQPLILLPNQYVEYNNTRGFSDITESTTNDEILWVQGVLKFDDTPLDEVVEELENWYGVHIEVTGNTRGVHYSGKFQEEYLSNILESMSFSLGLEYTIQNENVQLKLKQ